MNRPGCPRWESNPHWDPFKGPASADWATGAQPGAYRRLSRLRREVHVLGLDRARRPTRRRLVGPVQVGVSDDLLGRRRAPLRQVLGGVRVTDQGGVVAAGEGSVQRR